MLAHQQNINLLPLHSVEEYVFHSWSHPIVELSEMSIPRSEEREIFLIGFGVIFPSYETFRIICNPRKGNKVIQQVVPLGVRYLVQVVANGLIRISTFFIWITDPRGIDCWRKLLWAVFS